LEVTLASIAPQATTAKAEVVVVDDAGPSLPARTLVESYGAHYVPHPQSMGLNVARNTAVARSTGELVVFVDDDVEVCEGWLPALLQAAEENPQTDVFTGPVLPRLEGTPPRTCGREPSPITSLYLGEADIPARFAWGANMAIRRSSLQRIGPFDISLEHGGDEQEWQERLLAQESPVAPLATRKILYVAKASLHHRRSPADARLVPLCRAARMRGRAARRFDAFRGETPSIARELLTLARCTGHVVRYRCPAALTMVAHSTGRLEEALRTAIKSPTAIRTTSSVESPSGDPTSNGHPTDDFLSGESGTVGGLDSLRRSATDRALDALAFVQHRPLDRAARHAPPTRRILVLAVVRPEHRELALRAQTELEKSRHRVELRTAGPAARGKFQNINHLLEQHPPPADHDWLLVLDDDIELPSHFLDRFLFLAERFSLDLAQPAHRLASHAAWKVTRRRAATAARETNFVEIGPLTAFARSTFSTLLPFPDLRMGWGLDLHWGALARTHHLRCGVVDATPILHNAAPAASAYSREQALAEARTFLSDHPYLPATEAQQTITTHRRW
jgi:GT2 family glycosyltransferase